MVYETACAEAGRRGSTTAQCTLFQVSAVSKTLPAPGMPETTTKRKKVHEPCCCFTCHQHPLACKFIHACSTTCGDFAHPATACTNKQESRCSGGNVKLANSSSSSSLANKVLPTLTWKQGTSPQPK